MKPPAPISTPLAMTARAWGILLVLGSLWGGSFFLARVAVGEIEPLTLVLLRVSIAAAALWAFVLATRQDARPLRAEALPILFLALANNVIPFSLIFVGQTAIGAGLASIMNALTPFWTALIARGTGVEPRLSALKVAGIAVGFAGAALMVLPGLENGAGGPAWAKLAVIGAGVSYAVAGVFARRFRTMPPTLLATGQLTASTALMLPIVLIAGNLAGLATASPAAFSAVLALALVSTALAYILYFHLIATVGATNASLVTFVVPASALVLGAVFLGETLEHYEMAGMAVILAGLVVIDGRLFSRLQG